MRRLIIALLIWPLLASAQGGAIVGRATYLCTAQGWALVPAETYCRRQ